MSQQHKSEERKGVQQVRDLQFFVMIARLSRIGQSGRSRDIIFVVRV